MIILPLLSVILVYVLCAWVSITDIKSNKISNKILLGFGIAGLVLTFLQYYYKTNILWTLYVSNLVIIILFSIILYVLHIWAAGDSKLLIILGVLLPANYCVLEDKIMMWGIVVIAISFIASFIFIVGESLVYFLIGKEKICFENVKKNIKKFLYAYVRNMIYISFVLKIEKILGEDWFSSYSLEILGINICVILLIGSFQIFGRTLILVVIFSVSVIFSLVTGKWFFDMQRVIYYLLVIIVMLIRVMISEYNYKTLPTEEVKKGMILSTLTTVFMSKSKIKDLPEISHEDMRSRLTKDEAEAVVRWGNSKYGLKEIQIVRKVPFAIFIFIGVLLYTIAWGICN